MSADTIPVGSTGKSLQVWTNAPGSTEAVTLTNSSGVEITTLPVSIAGTVAVSGTVTSTPSSASTGTNSSVAGTTTASTTLLASNSSRKNASFFNDSTAILYLSRGATATTTNHSVQIPPNGYYELPNPGLYTGIVTGVWASATGSCRITEDT